MNLHSEHCYCFLYSSIVREFSTVFYGILCKFLAQVMVTGVILLVKLNLLARILMILTDVLHLVQNTMNFRIIRHIISS